MDTYISTCAHVLCRMDLKRAIALWCLQASLEDPYLLPPFLSKPVCFSQWKPTAFEAAWLHICSVSAEVVSRIMPLSLASLMLRSVKKQRGKEKKKEKKKKKLLSANSKEPSLCQIHLHWIGHDLPGVFKVEVFAGPFKAPLTGSGDPPDMGSRAFKSVATLSMLRGH